MQQLGFSHLALGDVRHQAGEHASPADIHLRDPHRELNGGTVAVRAAHFMLRGSGIADLGHILDTRDQPGQGPAANLAGEKAEQALGGGVEGIDVPHFVGDDDALRRRFHHGAGV